MPVMVIDEPSPPGRRVLRDAGAVLSVHLVCGNADAGERPDGDWWGSSAWLANARGRRVYGETES